VLDYYNNDPGKTVWQKALDACGQQVGAKISRESVPGATLIQKVLQQASSRTLPDVLMLDNPDLQQIAQTGALVPLDTFGLNANGYAKGVVDASTYQGKLYGLQPVTNTIGLFYNKDMLAKAGGDPSADEGPVANRGQEADLGEHLRPRLLGTGELRGYLAILALHVVERRRREEHRDAPDRASRPAVGRPDEHGQVRVEVGAELDAGGRQ